VTGFVDEAPGRLDHIRVAEVIDGELRECGQARFGVGRESRPVGDAAHNRSIEPRRAPELA
jgi:hypothetical protein